MPFSAKDQNTSSRIYVLIPDESKAAEGEAEIELAPRISPILRSRAKTGKDHDRLRGRWEED